MQENHGAVERNRATIHEVVTAVNIMLGNASLSACNGADLDRDGRVTVDEINQAILDSLQDCPMSGVAGHMAPVSENGSYTLGPLTVPATTTGWLRATRRFSST
jgi:hypothetical protein